MVTGYISGNLDGITLHYEISSQKLERIGNNKEKKKTLKTGG